MKTFGSLARAGVRKSQESLNLYHLLLPDTQKSENGQAKCSNVPTNVH